MKTTKQKLRLRDLSNAFDNVYMLKSKKDGRLAVIKSNDNVEVTLFMDSRREGFERTFPIEIVNDGFWKLDNKRDVVRAYFLNHFDARLLKDNYKTYQISEEIHDTLLDIVEDLSMEEVQNILKDLYFEATS